jgi:acetyltransferase-like isoleucine patch superfamily enzyme
MTLPEPKIIIIGAGLGATQVLDILRSGWQFPGLVAVRDLAHCLIDDNKELWGTERHGLPVIGGSDKLKELGEEDQLYYAVISISTSIKARMILSDKCIAAEVPLATVRHKTAYVADTAQVGFGNVICAYCHIGAHTKVGDNNFFSAYNSFDHHNVIGDHCSTGPANATSGIVEIGSRVRLGTGIHVEPHWKIGDDSFIASGCLIREDIPPNSKVMMTGQKLLITSQKEKP